MEQDALMEWNISLFKLLILVFHFTLVIKIFYSESPNLLFLNNARDFNATSLSTYDFSTLYITLPHNLVKETLTDLIERTFQREGSPYLACNERNAFFTSEQPKKYHARSYQNVCDVLTFLLDNICVRFGTKKK